MDQLTQAIPTVVFVAKDATGLELSAVKVSVDGEVVAEHLDGTAVPLDPGSHQLTFEAAGQTPVTRTIILHEGEKDRHEVLVVGSAAPLPAAPTPAPVSTTEPATHDGGDGRRTLGFVVGGTGVAGLVVGSVFGALSFSSWGSANRECPTHAGCPIQATQDRSSAVTSSTISTVAFIAGGALLASGITLYFTAPKDHTPTTGVEIAPGVLRVVGTF
jgi:hypothetical protein